MNSNKEEITITVIDRQNEAHTIEVPLGVDLNLMEVCKAYELPVKGTCGGMALCSTCHCYVESQDMSLEEPNEHEEDMLDQAFFVESNSRLGCQIKMTENLDGLIVRLAPEDEEL